MEKILLVGSGSIAARYLKVVLENFPELEVDQTSRSNRSIEIRGPKHKSVNWSHVIPHEYRMIIIGSRTSQHMLDLCDLGNAASYLVEKPLFASRHGAETCLNTFNHEVVWVSSPLRQMRSFAAFQRRLSRLKVMEVRVVCRSDLGTWRSWRDPTNGYWANPQEGGVLRELIHEIDYIQKLFGSPTVSGTRRSKGERYPMEADAKVHFWGSIQNGANLEVSLDWEHMGPPERYCEVLVEDGILKWDILRDAVLFTEIGGQLILETTGENNRDDLFTRQISFCLGYNDEASPPTSFQEGLLALETIERIESL